MKNFPKFFCYSVLFILSACSRQPVADRIYFNARIWTADSANPAATALAMKDSTIIYVGNDYDQYKGANTQLIDIQGKMIVPGFIDNHTHFLGGGYQLSSVNLRNVKSTRE